MKQRWNLSLLAVLLLGLAARPARAQRININVNQDTFVISNEAPGFLITRLIAAGHGGDSVYQATVYLASMPGAGAIITPAFLNALATCPTSSEIFTTTVAQVTAQGISVSISTDGTARYDNIEGGTYAGRYPVIQTGNATVQNVRLVHSTDSQVPLNANVVQGPLAGMTTTYNAFAVAWALPDSPPSATPAPPSLWLVLTGCLILLGYALWSRRRAVLLPLLLLSLATLPAHAQIRVNQNQDTFVISNEGPGFLITKLIAAGHGGDSPYQATLFLAGLPGTGAVFPPTFFALLANAPHSADIFTRTLAEYSGAGTSISINTDGTLRQDDIHASTFVGLYPTIATGNGVIGNVGIVHSTDSQVPLNATVIEGPLAGMTTTYNAFAVAWALPDSPPSATPAPPSLILVVTGGLALLGRRLWRRRRA
jgi:hypothetical protein